MADPAKVNIRIMKALEAQAESLKRIETHLSLGDPSDKSTGVTTSNGADTAGKAVKSHG